MTARRVGRCERASRRKRSEGAVGKEEKSNKRGVRDRLASDTQVKWRCARDRVSAVRPHHETNDDDGDGGRGLRKGGDDDTEGETKAECE